MLSSKLSTVKIRKIPVQREATGWLQDPSSWPSWLARITTLSVRRHGQPSKTPPIGLRVMCQRTPIRAETTWKSTCNGKTWRRKDWSSTTSTGPVFTLLTAGSTTVASSAELVFVALVPPRLAKECGRGGRGVVVAAPTVVEDEDETTIDLRQFRPLLAHAARRRVQEALEQGRGKNQP